MFSLSYTQPAKLAGKIHMVHPITSLGTHIDVNGNAWDVRMARYTEGRNFVAAVPTDELHPCFHDTSGANFGLVEQTWEPYEVIYESNS